MRPVQATGIEFPDAQRANRDPVYAQGRRDGRAEVKERAFLQERNTAVRQAYDRGRRDERARLRLRRRGSPVLGLLVLVAAGAGGLAVYLAAREGSFSRGGAVVDQQIASVTHAAESRAGSALQDAGGALKRSAG